MRSSTSAGTTPGGCRSTPRSTSPRRQRAARVPRRQPPYSVNISSAAVLLTLHRPQGRTRRPCSQLAWSCSPPSSTPPGPVPAFWQRSPPSTSSSPSCSGRRSSPGCTAVIGPSGSGSAGTGPAGAPRWSSSSRRPCCAGTDRATNSTGVGAPGASRAGRASHGSTLSSSTGSPRTYSIRFGQIPSVPGHLHLLQARASVCSRSPSSTPSS